MPRRAPSSGSNVLIYLLAIILPFVAVAMKVGVPPIGCADVLINIALDLLGWIPGIIHAWWCIARAEKTERAQRQHFVHGPYTCP
ncbi:hypothetical protein JCM8097_001687 [Rhodosporidiobolus ruineniae]